MTTDGNMAALEAHLAQQDEPTHCAQCGDDFAETMRHARFEDLCIFCGDDHEEREA